MRFSEKVVIVTGAGSGIGRRTAERFAQEGASVCVADVNEVGARVVAEEINGDGREVLAVHTDVSEPASVRNLVAEVVDRWRRIDVVFNNAGIEGSYPAPPFDELPDEEFDRVIAVNLRGVFLVSKYALPYMREGSAIVNNASIAGLVGMVGTGGYGPSKGGVVQLTRELAMEVAGRRIRVNAVAPGVIQTPMIERALAGMGDREEALAGFLGMHPLGRLGTPDDIAYAVLFLASEAASFITGVTLPVDGGYTAQ